MKKNTNIEMALAAIFIVGIVGVLGMVQVGSSGAAVVKNDYCICELDYYGYDGSLLGQSTQRLQSRLADPHTDEFCNMRCQAHFERVGQYTSVSGYAEQPTLYSQ